MARRTYTSEQRERSRKRSRDWYWANKARVQENFARWYAGNKERVIARSRNWVAENRGRHEANQAAWRERMSHLRCSQAAARRAVTKKATPAWANDFFITEAYRLAKLRTKMLGYPWHVDHIVPLNSKLVCGLHVEHNLQVIPGAANIRKQNLHWPDMP